jgi:predicted RecB family nuclease
VHQSDGQLVVGPTDLVNFLECPHLTELSLRVGRRELAEPPKAAEETAAQRRGLAHERAYRVSLETLGRSVTAIDTGPDRAARVQATLAALATGADAIYQAAFFDDSQGPVVWVGYADFLSRVETPSSLGSYSYEPEDTKLAHHVRPRAVLQLCSYAEQLARLQGRTPELAHVVLGDHRRESLHLVEFSAYFRSAKAQFQQALAERKANYPNPVEHCALCLWRERCDEQRAADDHLSLVPGLSTEQRRRLSEGASISTVTGLAAFTGTRVPGISTSVLEKLQRQARLLVTRRLNPLEPPPYQMLPTTEPGLGLAALPQPDGGDLFFDIEGDPYVDPSGLEYLLGVGWANTRGEFEYRAFWSHDEPSEKSAFEEFIDFVVESRTRCPGLHVYHYAPYEPAALKRLMGRHGTREREVDDLLRGRVLVDLYQVVRQGVCVGTPSYSLKKLESLYMPPRTEAITDAGSSIEEYERWLESGDQTILDELEAYNRVDCDSTRRLRDWLEARRPEFEQTFGTVPPRPPSPDREIADVPDEHEPETDELKAMLDAWADGSDGAPAGATRLLSNLLEWHRREAKPVWWQFFHRVLNSDHDDLWADSEAVAGLAYEGEVEQVKESVVYRYRFDPDQPYKLSAGERVKDPEAERLAMERDVRASSPGSLVRIDPVEGTLDLQRGRRSGAPHPRHLIPGDPYQTSYQREALRRLARSVIEHGIDGPGPYRCVRDLLLRQAPRLREPVGPDGLLLPGESAALGSVRLATALDAGCLAIQGPPGSGKTSTAAKMVVELAASGHTVGITANSHAVISHLLEAVLTEARHQGRELRASQKADPGQGAADPGVTRRGDVAKLLVDLDDGVKVIGGTAWVFSRPELDQRLDYLVVDEAGQLSLANVCAVATSARNLVLVGDPRQLSQPSQGTHPEGAGASALEHVLGDADTIPPNLGVFLDYTHRLHPAICQYISEIYYQGRLQSRAGCELQTVLGSGWLSGSGLRWAPTEHQGNVASSTEEASAVVEIVGDLLGRTWIDRRGAERPIGLDDILVVAPFNAQVARLGTRLPVGARVGTVDRFQGQEAAVVIVSLTTSSADDTPRGLDFLFSRERLNVAVSRAQALSVIVGSPALLWTRCHTVGQLRLVNGLCRYVELAPAGGDTERNGA